MDSSVQQASLVTDLSSALGAVVNNANDYFQSAVTLEGNGLAGTLAIPSTVLERINTDMTPLQGLGYAIGLTYDNALLPQWYVLTTGPMQNLILGEVAAVDGVLPAQLTHLPPGISADLSAALARAAGAWADNLNPIAGDIASRLATVVADGHDRLAGSPLLQAEYDVLTAVAANDVSIGLTSVIAIPPAALGGASSSLGSGDSMPVAVSKAAVNTVSLVSDLGSAAGSATVGAISRQLDIIDSLHQTNSMVATTSANPLSAKNSNAPTLKKSAANRPVRATVRNVTHDVRSTVKKVVAAVKSAIKPKKADPAE
jgi:hypothetical protein